MKFSVDDHDCAESADGALNQRNIKPVYVIFCQPEDLEKLNGSSINQGSGDDVQDSQASSGVDIKSNLSLSIQKALESGTLNFSTRQEADEALDNLGWSGICKIGEIHQPGDVERFLNQKLKSFGPYFGVHLDYDSIPDKTALAAVDEEFRPGVFASAGEAERVARKLGSFGARFAKFPDYFGACEFVLHGVASSSHGDHHFPTVVGIPDEAPLRFDAPKRNELVQLKKAIEGNRFEEVDRMIFENPRTLVNCKSDSPTLLHEGMRFNAMHIAAREGAKECAELIMDAVSGSLLLRSIYPDDNDRMNRERRRLVTAAYVNMPDKTSLRSPLHWAAKKGHSEVARVICTEELCDKNLTDKSGDTALHIACAEGHTEFVKLMCSFGEVDREIRNSDGKSSLQIVKDLKSAKLRDQLTALLSGSLVYIPLYRDCGLSEAKVKPPTQENPDNHATDLATLSPPTPPIDSAGRISPPLLFNNSVDDMAPSLSAIRSSPLARIDLRFEAPADGPFSPGFPSTSAQESKQFLAAVVGPCSTSIGEAIYRSWTERSKKAMSIKRSDPHKGLELLGRSLAKDHNVPWKEYWSFLNESCDLRSQAGLAALEKHLERRRKDRTPGGKVTSIKRFLHYSGSPYSPMFAVNAVGKLGIGRGERSDRGKKRFFSRRLVDETGFIERPEAVAEETDGRLATSGTDQGRASTPIGSDSTSPNTPLTPSGRLTRNDPGAPTTHNDQPIIAEEEEDMFFDASDQTGGDESMIVNLNDSFTSSLDSHVTSDSSQLANETGLALRLDEQEPSVAGNLDLSLEIHTSTATVMEQDGYDTPPDSPTNVPFILGDAPTKLDMDVLAALDGVKVDPLKHPKVCGWLQSVQFYGSDDRKNWPSIDSARFTTYVDRRMARDE